MSGGRRLFIYDVTILMYLLGGKTPQHHTIKLKTGGCGRSSSTADLEPSRLEKNNRNGCGSSPSARQVPCSSWLLLWMGPSLPRRAPLLGACLGGVVGVLRDSSVCLIGFYGAMGPPGASGKESIHILYGLLHLFSAVQKCGHYSELPPFFTS